MKTKRFIQSGLTSAATKLLGILILSGLTSAATRLGAQTPIEFVMQTMTGSTNDEVLNIQSVNNPVIWNGIYYWLPQNGTTIQTTNGIGYVSLIPGQYTVSIVGLPQSWSMGVTNSLTLVNAANLPQRLMFYSGVNSVVGGANVTVVQSPPGTFTVSSTGGGSGAGTITNGAATIAPGVQTLGPTILISTNYDAYGSAAAAIADIMGLPAWANAVNATTNTESSVTYGNVTVTASLAFHALLDNTGPSSGTSGQYLKALGSATYQWSNDAGGLTNVPGTNVVGTVPQATNATTVGGFTATYIPYQGVTIEQFGGIADTLAKYDVQITNGQQVIGSPSGGFSAADVGKFADIYTNQLNTNFFQSLIIADINSTEVELSNAAPVTCALPVEMRWGHDNTTPLTNAIAYCLSNFVQNIYFTNGCYGFFYPPRNTGTNLVFNLPVYSVIPVACGASWHDYNTTDPMRCLNFIGGSPAYESQTGYYGNQQQSNMGTMFFIGSQGNGGQDYLFSMSGQNSSFGHVNVTFKNIHVYHPCWPTVGFVDNCMGAGCVIDSCTPIYDAYSIVASILAAPTYQAQGQGTTNLFMIFLAMSGNNGHQAIINCDIEQGFNGVYMSDHSYIDGLTKLTRFANASVNGTGFPEIYNGTEFDVNMTNIAVGYVAGAWATVNGSATFDNDDQTAGHNCINANSVILGNLTVFNNTTFPVDLVYQGTSFYQGSAINAFHYSDLRQNYSQEHAFRENYGEFLSAGVTSTNSAYDVQIGGPWSANSGNINPMFYNGQYNSSAERIGTGGHYVFDTSGNVQFTFNIANQGPIGTLYAGAFVGNGSGLTNLNPANLSGPIQNTNVVFSGYPLTLANLVTNNPSECTNAVLVGNQGSFFLGAVFTSGAQTSYLPVLTVNFPFVTSTNVIRVDGSFASDLTLGGVAWTNSVANGDLAKWYVITTSNSITFYEGGTTFAASSSAAGWFHTTQTVTPNYP